MKAFLLISGIVSVGMSLTAGCASTTAHRGMVVQPKIGSPHMDFTYVDEAGESQQLSRHLGDYTVLAFMKCEGDLHGPMSQELQKLMHIAESPGYASTVGFDIHWSDTGCTPSKECHLVQNDAHMYSICDAQGVVRKLYGADQRNQIFVLGPDGRIVDASPVSKLNELGTRLKSMVRSYAAEKNRQQSVDH